jgi:beta-N-acetylhexosaminidase
MKIPSFDSLSIEQKIGQLFFIGIPGAEFDDSARKLFGEIKPGGVCFFARNIRRAEQTRKLVEDIRGASMIEPLLSIDQEGGLVDRLRRISTPMPSAKSLRSPEDAKTLARITAEILRLLGINMNFAPVVDVLDPRREKFSNGLQSRAFGKSKEDVLEFASAYLAELHRGEILGCLKHFPGLGASEVDSHDELPSVNIPEDELTGTDLFPYKKMFGDSCVHSVMIAHAAYPKSDLQERDANGKLLPSSLSFNFVSKLLRGELGFDGLALTDDLEMGAILKNYGIGEACKLAIKAGNDMLLICAGVDAVREGHDAISRAVSEGDISEKRIDESLRRISRAKEIARQPPGFDVARLNQLSDDIARLNEKLGYRYGG